jgi:predicted enzyme related to lactoylglutathione lyase
MGRIVTSRLAGVGGIRFTVAVADIAGTTSRAIALGGGTAAGQTSWASDVGDFALLIDPDGNRFGIFHGKLRGHSRGQPRSGVEDAG